MNRLATRLKHLVREHHVSIPLGAFSQRRQHWYQVGYSLDVFHRIPVRQNIKLGNAEAPKAVPFCTYLVTGPARITGLLCGATESDSAHRRAPPVSRPDRNALQDPLWPLHAER